MSGAEVLIVILGMVAMLAVWILFHMFGAWRAKIKEEKVRKMWEAEAHRRGW